MARTVKYTVNFMDAEEADLHRFVNTSVALGFYTLHLAHPQTLVQGFAAHAGERAEVGVSPRAVRRYWSYFTAKQGW